MLFDFIDLLALLGVKGFMLVSFFKWWYPEANWFAHAPCQSILSFILASSRRKASNWTVAASCFVLARPLPNFWRCSSTTRPSPTSTWAETNLATNGLRPEPCQACGQAPDHAMGAHPIWLVSLEHVKNMEPQNFLPFAQCEEKKRGSHGCHCSHVCVNSVGVTRTCHICTYHI